MRVGITGNTGFLGWHLSTFLSLQEEVELVNFHKEYFDENKKLQDFVSGCDVVIHLAGMNRGEEDEVYSVNVGLTEKLIKACVDSKVNPQIIFSSSIHENKDTAYGRSKNISSEMLKKWSEKNQSKVTVLSLPNVFGEFQKEKYNSVVATYCGQIVRGEKSEINANGEVELVHVSEVVSEIHSFISDSSKRNEAVAGSKMKVSELYYRLESLWDLYKSNRLPQLSSNLDVRLFNTLRSYINHKDYFPRNLDLKTDDRGKLFEFIQSKAGGQGFISWTKEGVTRGNHFHTRKFERFCVVEGEAQIEIRRVGSVVKNTFIVNGKEPCFMDMPTFFTHNITNIGNSPLITVFWSNEFFDSEDSDTQFCVV